MRIPKKEKTDEEIDAENERGLTEWLNKKNPLSNHRNKIWLPLSDYKDVGSFNAFNKGKKKSKPGFGKMDLKIKTNFIPE